MGRHYGASVKAIDGYETLEERIFFSPIGMGTEDVCLCHEVFKLAQEKGIGRKLGLFG